MIFFPVFLLLASHRKKDVHDNPNDIVVWCIVRGSMNDISIGLTFGAKIVIASAGRFINLFTSELFSSPLSNRVGFFRRDKKYTSERISFAYSRWICCCCCHSPVWRINFRCLFSSLLFSLNYIRLTKSDKCAVAKVNKLQNMANGSAYLNAMACKNCTTIIFIIHNGWCWSAMVWDRQLKLSVDIDSVLSREIDQ